MISPIVVCRVAPMVRLILTKSYTPATLCTVPQRTSQQSEKLLFILLLINRIELLPRGTLSISDINQCGIANAGRAQSDTLLSFFDARPACGFLAPCDAADSFQSFSGASKPLLIRCEHFILQTILTHTLVYDLYLCSSYC